MNDAMNSFGTRPKYVYSIAPAEAWSMMCCHTKIMIFTKIKPSVIMGNVRVGILSFSGIIQLISLSRNSNHVKKRATGVNICLN